MCVGSGFLVLELGRPLHAWRVFMNPKAILTIGAWMMTLAILSGFLYAAMDLPLNLIFWRDWAILGKALAAINLVTGLTVATYPGVLLGQHKGRPFWAGPGIMTLFLLSSLVTGCALHYLCGLLVPAPAANFWHAIPGLVAGLLLFQLLLWAGYLWIKLNGATAEEAASALRWTSGDLSLAFKIGFVALGTVAPLVLVLLAAPAEQAIGAGLVLLGGLTMRLLAVRSGEDRTMLPGERRYNLRLPTGDEEFLRKNWL
jgi:formate-dependent nitrite reductase membrane component NrfD